MHFKANFWRFFKKFQFSSTVNQTIKENSQRMNSSFFLCGTKEIKKAKSTLSSFYIQNAWTSNHSTKKKINFWNCQLTNFEFIAKEPLLLFPMNQTIWIVFKCQYYKITRKYSKMFNENIRCLYLFFFPKFEQFILSKVFLWYWVRCFVVCCLQHSTVCSHGQSAKKLTSVWFTRSTSALLSCR